MRANTAQLLPMMIVLTCLAAASVGEGCHVTPLPVYHPEYWAPGNGQDYPPSPMDGRVRDAGAGE